MGSTCEELHRLFHTQRRLVFPFDRRDILQNGLYILFEDGERAHGGDRIVRVGTHTGSDQLPSRLLQHFVRENKDRSIFRKNVGRALLAQVHDPFLEQWDWDLTSREARERYAAALDVAKQAEVERQVSARIQRCFSFVVLAVPDREERLRLEKRIIATISLCDECRPSSHWLGLSSPKDKIRNSGLWQVYGLYRSPLSITELPEIRGFTVSPGPTRFDCE